MLLGDFPQPAEYLIQVVPVLLLGLDEDEDEVQVCKGVLGPSQHAGTCVPHAKHHVGVLEGQTLHDGVTHSWR